MASQVKVRELLLYSEKIKEGDVRNLFNQILKSTMPFLGFIDFRDIFSPNFINIITKRKLNTMQFFAKERKGLADMSMLVFPYKVSEPTILEHEKGSMFPFPKVYFLGGSQDFLSLALKESILEVDLKMWKVLGKTLGFGSAVDEHGKKSIVVCTSPERFFEVDLEKNPSVYIEILDPIPKRMSVASRYPVFEETGISVGPDNFDIFQHTLVIGASGTGKSKGLYAMIQAIRAAHPNDLRLVLIDPHGEFIKMFPDAYIVDLVKNYIEPLDVGGNKTPLMTQLISQLLSSAIGGDNKYSERVLFYAVHLLSSIDSMNLKNVSLLLTDSSKRAEFVSSVENDEIKRFFDEEFNDIYIHHFNDAILPVLNFVGEYELYLGGDKKKEDLLNLIRKNPITVISFNPNFFGKRMINFLAGAVINQMYILAITEKLEKPTILVMDEFQRVETKVVKDILSETRKFNLYAYLSMQYLGQMQKEIHDSIVSNIRNIVSFKLNKQDATMISSIMEIKIEESFKKARTQTELEESKKEMFVRLHQRECIVRLFDGKKYILPMKLHVVDVARWGYKSSMEVSKMDAMHDASDSEGKPPAVQYGQAQPQSGAQQQSGTYSVNYPSQSSHAPPVVPPHEQPDEKKDDEQQEPEQEEKENPFAPQDAMEESGLMISKEDEGQAPEEEEQAEVEPAEEKEEQPAEEEQSLAEEESPPDEDIVPEEEEISGEPVAAPRKKGRRGMVRVDFDEFESAEEPEEKPARKSRKLAQEEELVEDEAPEEAPSKPAKKSRKPKKSEALPEVDEDGEEPIIPVTDEDEVLAEKLARIRAKAMKLHPESAEAPAPAKKASGKKAAAPAKKPAKKGKK